MESRDWSSDVCSSDLFPSHDRRGEASNMEDGVFPTIYTEKKDGVQPEYDIRTDRFEVAIDAMDKINQSTASQIAKNKGETQKAEAKVLEAKKRTEEATADLRELQYWTEIANTIIKLAQLVGNLAIGGKAGKAIREYTERKMSGTPLRNSSTVTQHFDPEMRFKGVDRTVTTRW